MVTTPELAELVVVCAMALVCLSGLSLIEERIGSRMAAVTLFTTLAAVLATEIRLIVAVVVRVIELFA